MRGDNQTIEEGNQTIEGSEVARTLGGEVAIKL